MAITVERDASVCWPHLHEQPTRGRDLRGGLFIVGQKWRGERGGAAEELCAAGIALAKIDPNLAAGT